MPKSMVSVLKTETKHYKFVFKDKQRPNTSGKEIRAKIYKQYNCTDIVNSMNIQWAVPLQLLLLLFLLPFLHHWHLQLPRPPLASHLHLVRVLASTVMLLPIECHASYPVRTLYPRQLVGWHSLLASVSAAAGHEECQTLATTKGTYQRSAVPCSNQHGLLYWKRTLITQWYGRPQCDIR